MFLFFQICCIKHADERYNCRCSSGSKASGNNLGMCKGIPRECLLFCLITMQKLLNLLLDKKLRNVLFYFLYSSSSYPSYSFSPMIEVYTVAIYSLYAQDILAGLVCSSLRNMWCNILNVHLRSKYLSF